MRSIVRPMSAEGLVAIANRSTCLRTRQSLQLVEVHSHQEIARATSEGSAPRLTIAPTTTLSASEVEAGDSLSRGALAVPGRDEIATVSPT